MTGTDTVKKELQSVFSERAEAGMVDIKFCLSNLGEATPSAVYAEVLGAFKALENDQFTELSFNDSYKC